MKTSVILAASTTLLPLSAIAAETISCDALPTCAELGYTETVAQCPGKYLVCPFDRTLGTCIHDAKVGQIGYFTKDPGNGWLLCDGKIYNAKKYPDLAAALADKYVLSSTRIQVPDYRGDFLRVYGDNYSLTVNTRTAESLPNIYGYFNNGIAVGVSGSNVTPTTPSGAFNGSPVPMDNAGNKGGSGRWVGYVDNFTFDASKSNPIYKGSSVTPVNTAVYAYIYAGKVDSSAGSPTLPSCSEGQYYYADGTCSSSYNSEKTLRGIVLSTSTSYRYIRYITGGVSTTNNGQIVENNCKKNSGYIAYNSDWQDLQSKNISTSVVKSPQASNYYWTYSTLNLYYCSSASSCSSKSGTVSSNKTATNYAYYYCYYYDYYAK